MSERTERVEYWVQHTWNRFNQWQDNTEFASAEDAKNAVPSCTDSATLYHEFRAIKRTIVEEVL